MRSPVRLKFPNADVELAPRFSKGQDYDAQARSAALRSCARFRRAVEVGAHVGLHTRFLGQKFGRVEAFEPQQQCYECLVDNVVLPSVRAHRVAMADSKGVGYVTEKVGRNSGLGEVSAARAKDTGPVPLRTIDSYGWTDVDLIRVAAGRNFDNILLGALGTIKQSFPVIWIAAADVHRGARKVEVFMALGCLGYGVQTLPDGSVVLSHDTADRPGQTDAWVLRSETGPDLMVWREDAADQGQSAVRALLDKTLVEVTSRPCLTEDGRATASAVAVPPGFDPEAHHVMSRPGRRDFSTSEHLVVEETWEHLLEEGVTLAAEGASYRLALPWAAIVGFDGIKVSVPHKGGDERILLRRALRDLDNLDHIPIALPPSLLTQGEKGVEVVLTGPARKPFIKRFRVAPDPSRFSPEIVNFYKNGGGGGDPAVRAMASSVDGRVFLARDGYRPGVSFVWGVLRGSLEVIRASQAAGSYFYYMDHAYFDRGHGRNYRITLNGFEAGAIRRQASDRLQALRIRPKRWNRDGRYVLVCPPTAYFTQAHGCESWLDDTLAVLKANTDREIIVRQKPQPGETVTPLEDALRGAHTLVTHSSNVAVEAVIAGTPVFVSPASAAASVGMTDFSSIESPVYPEREPWLAHLAYSQFSFNEISSGAAWRLLLENETKEFL